MIKFHKKIGATAEVAPTPAAKKKVVTASPLADHEPLFQITDFPQNHILYHIHKNGTRKRPPRHHNRVHASDLDPARQYCPREGALLTLHDKKRPTDFTATATRMTWAMGYKGADLLMDFIPDEKMWGDWYCQGCKQTMERCYTPKRCHYCEAHRRAITYSEVLLRDPATGIVGSVDLFVDILGNGTKTPIEIKTEGNDSFKKRTKATFDHEWRTMLYLQLIEKSPWTKAQGLNHQEGRVMYFTKEGFAPEPKIKEWKLGDWAKSSVKEYWVTRNDDMVANQVELAASYRNWRNLYDANIAMKMVPSPHSITLPEREPNVTGIDCTRCKNCPVKKECWV